MFRIPFLAKVVALTLAAVGIIISCNSPLVGPPGQAVLSITIGNQVNSRTLAPTLDMNPASYAITGTGPSGATFTATSAGGTVTRIGLAFGPWTLVANATNAAGTLVGTGTAIAQVSTGATTAVTVNVTPITGTGTLSLGVSWPAAQVQAPSINASLIPALGGAQALPFAISGAAASYSSATIGNSYYTLSFTLLDNSVIVAGTVEVIRIVAGQTTSGTYSFAKVNALGGTIQVGINANMQNPLTVAIAGAKAILAQGSTETLTASVSNCSGNVVYVWYVNGVSVGTGATYTFGAGSTVGYSYRIDVTAFSADGTQAGSATAGVGVIAANPGHVLAGGVNHSLALKTDGTLWAFGSNIFGQLGDGTVTERHSPVQMMGGVSSVVAGAYHSLALKSDGTLWAFGQNWYGQLDDGTATDRHSPVRVMGDVSAMAGGYAHSLALKDDGTLWAFGWNLYGQLGDGTVTDRISPVRVMGGVSAVAAGVLHSLALKTDGTLWAFGWNSHGQLGDGTATNRLSPVQVMGGVSAMVAGVEHSLALKTDGTLWAFGYNQYGQLGDGTVTTRYSPVKVMGGVIAVAAGAYHSLALKTDGTLWAFGSNIFGQLGDGTVTERHSPVQMMGGVGAVATGTEHSLALKTDGTLWAFGRNDYGHLGDGTTTNRSTPTQVPGWTF